jgi:hypothetical protein
MDGVWYKYQVPGTILNIVSKKPNAMKESSYAPADKNESMHLLWKLAERIFHTRILDVKDNRDWSPNAPKAGSFMSNARTSTSLPGSWSVLLSVSCRILSFYSYEQTVYLTRTIRQLCHSRVRRLAGSSAGKLRSLFGYLRTNKKDIE